MSDFSLSGSDTAEAIIMFDIGRVTVDAYRGTRFQRHIRYIIFKTEALSEWGDFKFRISKDGGFKPEAITANLEGGIVETTPLMEEHIHRWKYDRYDDLISISLPQVRVGSIIDLEYTITNSALYLPSWYFQFDIPCLRSEFSIHSPVEGYMTQFHGDVTPTKYESKYKGKFQHWLLTDIPPFKSEPMMPGENVYRSSVEFGTVYTKWSMIYADLRKDPSFWGLIQYSGTVKSIARSITEGIEDSLEMIRAISKYVKTEVLFDGVEDFFGERPIEVLRKKEGTAGDINILYAALLRQAGFRVGLVLLSTRDHGFILNSLPSLRQFNYVICAVYQGDSRLLLDATQKYLAYDLLPPASLNHKGFLVAETEYGWIGIEPVQRDRTTIQADLALEADGSLKGKVTYSRSGYAAYKDRVKYFESGDDVYRKEICKPEWQVSAWTAANINDYEQPVVVTFDVEVSDLAMLSDHLMILSPHLFDKKEPNPFTNEKRDYPIDYGVLIDELVICSIAIPDGYGIEKSPENELLTLPGGSGRYTFNFTSTDDKLIVMTRLEISKTLFQPEEYPYLKEFYARLIAKKSETIALEKKP